jgi:hypothetical protein
MIFVIINAALNIELVCHELELVLEHLTKHPNHSVQIWNGKGKKVGGTLT